AHPGPGPPSSRPITSSSAAGTGSTSRATARRGLKPPEGSFIEKLQKAYVAAIAEPTDQKRTEKLLDGYQVHIDDGPINFGWTGELKYPVARKNWMRNTMPTGYTASTHYSQPNSSDPEQWFKKA